MRFFFQIPVFKGAVKPILGDSINAGNFHGEDGLGDAPDPNTPGLDLVQKEGAVSAMIRIVNENPGEVRDVRQLCVCVCASFRSLSLGLFHRCLWSPRRLSPTWLWL